MTSYLTNFLYIFYHFWTYREARELESLESSLRAERLSCPSEGE